MSYTLPSPSTRHVSFRRLAFMPRSPPRLIVSSSLCNRSFPPFLTFPASLTVRICVIFSRSPPPRGTNKFANRMRYPRFRPLDSFESSLLRTSRLHPFVNVSGAIAIALAQGPRTIGNQNPLCGRRTARPGLWLMIFRVAPERPSTMYLAWP
jgi:hypothetical protein